jgi:2-polyprenyl-3-methyl-5-hydroxy-6-metoxy-1,4-benzoquinol methylase
MAIQYQQNSYDAFADQYAQGYALPRVGGFNFNLDLIIPRLVELIGSVDTLAVLDAGCGEGILSRSLTGTPARIVGIDISPPLIAYARQRDLTQSIAYEVYDLSQPLPQYRDTFDLIVSNLVLNDVPDYVGFITTLGTLLKPQGRMVLSMNNPYSALLREKVGNYFDSAATAQYAFGPVTYFHRTMEDYSRAFSQAGFVLRRLYDVQMTEAMVAQLPEKNHHFSWFPFYHRFPFIVILDLVKYELVKYEAAKYEG